MAANAKAQDQRQMIYEQNRQKFLQKNFSFAILQSENAMSVNNLASQQYLHQQYGSSMNVPQMMPPPNFRGKFG